MNITVQVYQKKDSPALILAPFSVMGSTNNKFLIILKFDLESGLGKKETESTFSVTFSV